MKFINAKCETRDTIVFINIEKIVLISKGFIAGSNKEIALIEVDGLNDGKGPVQVNLSAEEVIKLINGDNKTRIGFNIS
jgi:hypothetical protein